MAGEIQIQSGLTGTWSGSQVATGTTAISVNKQTSVTKKHQTTQSIGTSDVALSLGDIDVSKQHIVRLRNESATATVTVTAYSSADEGENAVCGILLPGETWGPGRLSAQTTGYPCIKLKSSAASTDVEVVAVDAGDPTL